MNAVILAGGRSRRMGRDKAVLPVGGVPMIVRLVEALRPCCGEVLVVANDPAPFAGLPVRVVPDAFPGLGPLAGLHAGLLASGDDLNFVLACDLPFASPALAAHMAARAERAQADAAVPLSGGRPEPLHAVYRRRSAPVAEGLLAAAALSMSGFLGRIRVCWVGEEEVRAFGEPERIFFNVNRPADLARAGTLSAAAPVS